jgi:hypothetical protein
LQDCSEQGISSSFIHTLAQVKYLVVLDLCPSGSQSVNTLLGLFKELQRQFRLQLVMSNVAPKSSLFDIQHKVVQTAESSLKFGQDNMA